MSGRVGVSLLGMLGLAIALSGCGTARETVPPRTAQEQMLISTAADFAIRQMPCAEFPGKKVFLDVTNLECYDKPYVVARLRQRISNNFGKLVADRAAADFVLEVGSGALSIDDRRFLLGIPSLTVPMPGMGSFATPELAFYKIIAYRAKAKMIFSLLDAKTNTRVADMPVCYSDVRDSRWWLLMLGPFGDTDLPEEVQ